MRLLLDADIPRSFLSKLKDQGHDVIDVRDLPKAKTPLTDEEIYKLACKERRVLITRDLDFSNILHYPAQASAGIVVLRTHLLSLDAMFKIISNLLMKTSEEQMDGNLIIAQRDRLRFYRKANFPSPNP